MKLRLQLLFSISLCALAMQKLCAQNADDFFHTGAQAYLTNNITTAKEQVDKGLKQFPDDIKLKKLDELLKQQQQQQQQQQNQQNQQQQQQKNQSQQNQSQSKQDQQKQQSEKQKEQQKRQEQQKQQQQNQNKNQEQQGEKEQPKEQTPPGQMSPDEAKRLLDSEKGDEQLLPASQKEKPNNRDHPLKDW